VPEWVREAGHEMISTGNIDNVWRIKVHKAK